MSKPPLNIRSLDWDIQRLIIEYSLRLEEPVIIHGTSNNSQNKLQDINYPSATLTGDSTPYSSIEQINTAALEDHTSENRDKTSQKYFNSHRSSQLRPTSMSLVQTCKEYYNLSDLYYRHKIFCLDMHGNTRAFLKSHTHRLRQIQHVELTATNPLDDLQMLPNLKTIKICNITYSPIFWLQPWLHHALEHHQSLQKADWISRNNWMNRPGTVKVMEERRKAIQDAMNLPTFEECFEEINQHTFSLDSEPVDELVDVDDDIKLYGAFHDDLYGTWGIEILNATIRHKLANKQHADGRDFDAILRSISGMSMGEYMARYMGGDDWTMHMKEATHW